MVFLVAFLSLTTTTVGHVAAVFFAMFLTALVCVHAFVMSAMTWIAMMGHVGFVMGAMFRAVVSLCIGVMGAMLSTGFILFAWVIGAMFGAIMSG